MKKNINNKLYLYVKKFQILILSPKAKLPHFADFNLDASIQHISKRFTSRF